MTTQVQKYDHGIDMQGLPLINAPIHEVSALPATTYPRIVFLTTDETYYRYSLVLDDWEPLASGAGNVVSVVAGHGVDVDATDPENPIVAVDETELAVPEANVTGLTAALAAKQPLDPDLTALAAAGNSTVLAATTASFLTADETKLDGIEALADVTDAANVDAAGAVMNSDTSTAAMSFVIDEDSFATDSATKVPTQQSTKAYVDAARAGLDIKQSVRVATTAAGTLASSFENGDTVDGVVLATGDRILIKDQAAGAENGIYVVAASGAPTRSTDADVSAEVTAGMATFVSEGTANGNHRFVLITDDPIVLGTTVLVFTEDSGIAQILAGNGLTKTGNTIQAVAGNGILTPADEITVDPAVVVRKNSQLIGNGSTEDITITHSLNGRPSGVEFLTESSGEVRSVFWKYNDANSIIAYFPTGAPPATNAIRVNIGV